MPEGGGRKPRRGSPVRGGLRGLGLTDQVVAWLKPEERPDWMTAERYASPPEELTVRESRYRTGSTVTLPVVDIAPTLSATASWNL